MSVIIVLLGVYLAMMVGHYLGFLITSFIPAKGLWMFVPFRVSGWKSSIYPKRVYRIKWEAISFDPSGYKED